MPRYRDDPPPAVRVYTVCDESRYLIVRNVPALGCGDQLSDLFATYGDVEECKPMDAEDCEPFTDVYWIKFSQVNNARFAKRKLDESVFFGNRLQVSYAPQFETLSDTKEKLEGRKKEILGRTRNERSGGSKDFSLAATHRHTGHFEQASSMANISDREYTLSDQQFYAKDPRISHVSSDKEYFASSSMNQTVRLVREKLDKIASSADNAEAGPAPKRIRPDNRRRI